MVEQRAERPAAVEASTSVAEPGDRELHEKLRETQRASGVRELTENPGLCAANDDHYFRPEAVPDFDASIRASLIRGLLWWAFFVSVGVAAFVVVLR